MTGEDDRWVRVAVGIVFDEQNRVLISQRPNYVHQGGCWEFPGGKVNDGEAVFNALIRELAEELGIQVLAAVPLLQVQHHYPDKQVQLDVWRVERYRGEPQGLEGQPLDWLTPSQLSSRAFPAADAPIIEALQEGAGEMPPSPTQ